MSASLPRRQSTAGIVSLCLAIVTFMYLIFVGIPHSQRSYIPMSAIIISGIYVWAFLQSRADRQAYQAALTLREHEMSAISERLKIAEELHDIVSHGLGMITMRAQAARLGAGDTQALHEALADIEQASRRATNELRHMLGVLRSPGSVPLKPHPTLDDLPRLIQSSSDNGLDITFIGDGVSCDESTGLAVYRIVQEALANVARHAGPTKVVVTVTRDDSWVNVDVADTGPEPGWVPNPGTGHGLSTMRSRAEALGGSLTAERNGTGFHVRASIPDEVCL